MYLYCQKSHSDFYIIKNTIKTHIVDNKQKHKAILVYLIKWELFCRQYITFYNIEHIP